MISNRVFFDSEGVTEDFCYRLRNTEKSSTLFLDTTMSLECERGVWSPLS